MSVKEFSEAFDTILNSYSKASPFGVEGNVTSLEINEYEKSLFLTIAQEKVIIELYSGRNNFNKSFEEVEEIRRYLEKLVKTTILETTTGTGITSNSSFFSLPSDVLFIIYESAQIKDVAGGFADDEFLQIIPVRHDSINSILKNPFRKASDRRILRLDSGNNKLELISEYPITSYKIRYITKPTPIILENLANSLTISGISVKTECVLPESLHQLILERAVEYALIRLGTKETNNNEK